MNQSCMRCAVSETNSLYQCNTKKKSAKVVSVCHTLSRSCPLFRLLLILLIILRCQSCFPYHHLCCSLCCPSSKHRFGEGRFLSYSECLTFPPSIIIPKSLTPLSGETFLHKPLSTVSGVWVKISCAQRASKQRQV